MKDNFRHQRTFSERFSDGLHYWVGASKFKESLVTIAFLLCIVISVLLMGFSLWTLVSSISPFILPLLLFGVILWPIIGTLMNMGPRDDQEL